MTHLHDPFFSGPYRAGDFMDENTKKNLTFIGARLREKSTYAGLTVLLGMVLHGANVGPYADAIAAFGMFVGAVFAIFMPEKAAS